MKPLLPFVAVLLSFVVSASAEETTTTESLLHRHVVALTADAMEGREAGTAGGRRAADYVEARLKEFGLEPIRQPFPGPRETECCNLLAVIRGSDETLAEEYILLGAHFDHIGRRAGVIVPGANDNASGTAVLLELARAWAAASPKPKRSLIFGFWDCEEKGLYGSLYFSRNPTVPLDRIKFAMTFDMVGDLRDDTLWIDGWRSGCGVRELLVRMNLARDENFAFEFRPLTEGLSDHVSFSRKGIPSILYYTGFAGPYHDPEDTEEKLSYSGMERIVRFARRTVDREAGASTAEIPRFRKAEQTFQEIRREGIDGQAPDRFGLIFQETSDESPLAVRGISRNMLGEKAGFQWGDRVLTVDGKPVTTRDEFLEATARAVTEIKIEVRRRGVPENVVLTAPAEPIPGGVVWRTSDAEPQTLIARYVLADSLFGNAGVQDGDRLYHVDGKRPTLDMMNNVDAPPRKLTLEIETDGVLRTIVVDRDAPKIVP